MEFIDTHAHPYLLDSLKEQLDYVVEAGDSGVTKIVLPNCSVDTVDKMRGLKAASPNRCYMAMGLHPTELSETPLSDLDVIRREFEDRRDDYVALGEVGLDLYWDQSGLDIQQRVFSEQLSMARKWNLPVILHSREALEQTLEVLGDFKDLRYVFHCFGGGAGDVEKIRRVTDALFGIGGVVTFKNSGLRDTLPAIGLDRIVLETDAPWLAPVPFRGKPNRSAYIPYIADVVGQSVGEGIESVAHVTTRNALDFFGIRCV